MARVLILLLLALTTSVRSQFFADFFQGLQPFVTNQPTLRPIFEQTRRPNTEQTRKNYRQTTKTDTTKAYENISRNSSQYNSSEDLERRRKTSSPYSNNYTTVKPRRTKETSRRFNNKKESFQNNNYDSNINSINDYYTEKPNYSNSYRAESYDRGNYYTTNNPLVNRPGVRPAVVDDRPPITNRPVKKPNYGVNPRPKDDDAIVFPDDVEESPEIIIGPDEDLMSAVEKKRYIELAERMCDKYKAIGTRAVQAIPLLPSPEPVNLNVSGCAPTTVPLVVGGKVVGVQEFPHMALLGWRKLQAAGYSWKCGGSLVSEQFVLTAAHCSFQDRDNTVVNGPPRAVQLGSSYLDDPGALVVRVSAVTRHPRYKQPRSYYDLALIKLVNAVKFSEVIKPACLGLPPAVGKPIIATGWGRTEYGGEQSHELRSVSLPVWPMSKCREVLGASRRLPDGPSADSQLCAGEEQGGKDTCQGDSGGPAQVQEGCIWRVVAVTSLGRSCGAAETPGLYALVHRPFIASQIFTQNDYDTNYSDNNQNNGNNDSQNSNNQFGNNDNYNNQNYNDRTQGSVTRRPSNNNYNNQHYGNDGQSYNRPQESVTRRPVSNNDNNNQNYGNDGQNNRPQESVTRRPVNSNENSYNNGQNNYNNDRPNSNVNYNRPQNNQNVYNTPRPDRNVADNYYNNDQNYGNNDRQQNDNSNNYKQPTTTQRPQFETNYGTQRPNRINNSGISDNNYNDYNRQQNSQSEYTTRNPIRNNVNRGSSSDYANNYNVQNNNRDQTNYNNNYPNNNRRIDRESYTINTPWWLTY